jgi:hypothetical protein
MKEVNGRNGYTTQRTNEAASPGIMNIPDHARKEDGIHEHTRKEDGGAKQYGDGHALQEESDHVVVGTQAAPDSTIPLSLAGESVGSETPCEGETEFDTRATGTSPHFSSALPKQSEATTETLIGNLRQYKDQWAAERNQRERDMDTFTDEMREEVIQMLQLFGIPYVEAPAEGEQLRRRRPSAH